MYCRQHGYPTAPLISYKITGIGTLWEVVVPLSELSITYWLSAEPLPSYRHETNHLRFQRHLRFRWPSPLHRSWVPGTGTARACLSPCLPCRWYPVGQLAHLRSPLIGSALLLLQFKQTRWHSFLGQFTRSTMSRIKNSLQVRIMRLMLPTVGQRKPMGGRWSSNVTASIGWKSSPRTIGEVAQTRFPSLRFPLF